MKLEFKYTSVERFTSVVIPVYRDAYGLEQTLNSLTKQTVPETDYEIIVSNDGGDENVSHVCQQYQVREIRIIPNRGSYYARNRALEESYGEYLAFIDADVTVRPDWIETGRDELQSADYSGGPVIIDESKIKEPAHFYESLYGFPTEDFFYEQHFCVTANLFVKRRVFEEIGGFDERLRSGGDNEFGKRVFYAGKYKQKYSNELTVLHPPRGSKKLIGKKVRLHKGRILLNKLFPERYNYPKPSFRGLLLSMVAPPRISSVNRYFNNDNRFTFFHKYFFNCHTYTFGVSYCFMGKTYLWLNRT